MSPDDEHIAGCNMVGHFVRDWVYPQVYRPKDLDRDHDGTETHHGFRFKKGMYSGWRLIEVPNTQRQRFARVRMLCRVCIEEEVDKMHRLAEHDKAVKAYAGTPGAESWSRMMASQDAF